MTAVSPEMRDVTTPPSGPRKGPRKGGGAGRRAGQGAERGGPQRRCAVTRVQSAPEKLLRFAVAPDGTLLPDLGGRLPGRGIWLIARRDVLEKALAKKLFSRAAKGPVIVPADLAEQVTTGLRQRCLEGLSLARRGGHAVCGQHKVRGLLEKAEAAILLQAHDAAEGGKRRLAALGGGLCEGLLIDESFSAEELGRPFARSSAVHVAVAQSGIAAKLLGDLRRLRSFEETVAPSGGKNNGIGTEGRRGRQDRAASE